MNPVFDPGTEGAATRYKAPLWVRYSLPFVSVAAMILVRMSLIEWFEGRYPLILFIIPVIVSAWFGGVVPAIIAGVAGVAAGVSLFQPYNLQILTQLGFERLVVFTLVCSICIFIITRLHNARYLSERNERKLQAEILDRRTIEENLRREMAVRASAEAALGEALRKAERASIAKTEFLANMSHEIRTPMNAVIGLTHILASGRTPPAQQQEIFATLKVSADSLLGLIDDMLDITKIEAESVEFEKIPFNLRHLAEDVMTIMTVKTNEKKLDFLLDARDLQHADFIGDPTRIKQIMMNLCGNAIKFTHQGSVSIALSTIASKDTADEVAISVIDTGAGIPEDKLKTIFEKFVQGDSTINRKYGGSGLGLAIVRGLTRGMGGTVKVVSEAGKGSTFTATIMLTRAAAIASDDDDFSLPAIEAVDTHASILVVEDNPANIFVMRAFLEQFGFASAIAMSGAEAVTKVQTGLYFAVLMDVQMPDMNGFETTRRIREQEKQSGAKRVPIIGLTAHAMGGDRDMCLEAGMDDYMSKPFDPQVLERKLKYLHAKAREAGGADARRKIAGR